MFEKEYHAAGVFVRDETGKILAFNRKYRPPGLAFPCGLVEEGEDPKNAAARECFEETGYHVEIANDVEPHIEKVGNGTVITYFARIISVDLPTHQNEGEHVWVDIDEFMNKTVFKEYNGNVVKRFIDHV